MPGIRSGGCETGPRASLDWLSRARYVFKAAAVSAALVAFPAVPGLGPPGDATAMELRCGDRSEIVDTLKRRYSEKQIAVGVTGGDVVEVFVSRTGSWTMIVTSPAGRSCFMAAGENWQSIGAPPGEFRIHWFPPGSVPAPL